MSSSVIVDTQVYLADDLQKRNLIRSTTGRLLTTPNVVSRNRVIAASGGSFSFTGESGNVLTYVKSDKQLTAAITSGGNTITAVVTDVLFLTFNVTSIVFTNNESTDANIELVHA